VGIAADLGYRFRRPNRTQRLMQSFSSTRPGAWLFSKVLRHLDDAVGRLTGGQQSLPGLLAGLPVIDVTAIGRKTGMPRKTHLISVPVGDTLALIGTNFGQRSTPAWALNLEADGRATLTHRGRSVDVVARAATAREEVEVIARSAQVYGGYGKYLERISGRRVRIFMLEPAAE